ncbi:hypothetical protein Ocin01_05324 [Orchesella cincta]|uniref:DUF4758 domain-containing protein n=1 Tax=Orchesella cincta TaxID=48709 RepID=A0A1D2N7X0_ORCCI|nr:hypothetical protein Ocin01_05324 [Orchesella cincta]
MGFFLGLSLSSNGAEAASEARSPPSYVQSRPVYSKPAPKLPKLLFKPPTPKDNEINGQATGSDPNLVTQTVYGFLDFVTTIGNTVMVFTPQTKKVENVNPSSTSQTIIQATVAPTSSAAGFSKAPKSIVSASSSVVLPAPTGNERKGKAFHFEESGPSSLIEASEYEPQVFATSFSSSSSSSDLDETTALESHVIVSAVPSSSFSIKTKPKQVHSPPFVQIRSEVNVVSATEELQSPQVVVVTPATTSSKAFPSSKGFTLKLPQRSQPVLISPVSSPLVVTAEKVFHPPPPPPPPSSPKPQETYQEESQDEPTGLVSQTFNTQVENGVTTVHETKIIGTYIGSQYARIFESSSSVLPVASTAQVIITPSKPAQTAASSTTAAAQSSIRTEESVVTNGDNYETSGEVFNDDEHDETNHDNNYDYDAYSHDSQHQQRLESNEYQEDNGNDDQKTQSKESVTVVEPTPTASEEQTHYVLPQNQKEKKAEIYISPVPNNNAYSRQPQLYVDINPAKSVDFIVTATPSNRGKPGRGSRNEYKSRFSNRFNKNSTPSSDVVEAKEQEKVEEDTRESGRRTSRFRSRGRSAGRQGSEDVVPTVSVYSQVVSATPTRRFGSGRGGAKTKEVGFKTIQSTRSFGASARQVQISPTSSTSIYRFKLNRPTGRWRFKPSPKPKVNIIKTQEEEELEQQLNEQSVANGGLKDLNTAGSGPNLNGHDDDDDELVQHSDNLNYEESRTETNEVVQDLEPELAPQTLRVSTVTPTEFEDLEKFLEIATIKSPYVFQAGNVKNTRFITVTKTFTREPIQPTLASSIDDATIENILATKPAYEKILEGSSDVATLPVIHLSGDMATPPLETITQSFSTTQLMLKTSILPVLYDGVTTLFTLTQSYFVTRLVTAHKTVPPMELFQFVPTKSLTEFNTALQEAGSEHSEQLLGSEDSDDPETVYAHIIAPPDELTSLGADFDPSLMDDKIPKITAPRSKGAIARPGEKIPASGPPNNAALGLNGLADQLGLTAEQLAFLQFLKAQKQPTQQAPTLPNNFFAQQLVPNPVPLTGSAPPQLQITSSPVVVDTTTTIVESKTLRIQFGAKPTYTTLYSTKIVPTRMTSYVTMSVAVAPTAAAPLANPFFNPAAFPLAYLG